MRSAYFIPVAVLALAVAACSDTTTSPTTSPTSGGGPLFSIADPVEPGSFTDPLRDPQKGVQTANTPSGGHLANNSAVPTCVVNADLSISCNGYSIAGVGNTDATLNLVAHYTATIDCNNPGKNSNNPVESHTTTFSAASGPVTLSSGRNGTLRVTASSVSPFSTPQGCPNPNWQPVIRSGTLVLLDFTYSLLFDGFTDPNFSVFIHQG